MADLIHIALDAMGGDNAPSEIVKGAIDALALTDKIKVTLLGDEETVKAELTKYSYPEDRVAIRHTTEIIEMSEKPVIAIRQKKDSSIVVGMNLVKNKEADAFVSAGSTGAILAGGQLLVGRIKGIERPPLGVIIPTAKGVALLVDGGANVDARPSCLVQFAQMGSIYMNRAMGIANPKVGIVNIGSEEEKGNALVKETFPLLKECKDINFIGSCEARDILNGDCDVIVCEAFTGNVILKTIEGMGKTVLGMIKTGLMANLRSKIGALLVKPALKKTIGVFDSSEYGGAPLLGLKGLVIKSHGSSNAKEIKNTLLQCETFIREDVNGAIAKIVEDIPMIVVPKKENA